MDRKEYMREYQRKWRARKKEDPEWAETEKARQRNVKAAQRVGPVSGPKLREDERRRHRGRYENDPEYRETKLQQSRDKYERDFRDNPNALRERTFRHRCKRFGITVEDFDRMFEEQGGVCKICGCPETRTQNERVTMLSIDHCHSTGRVRGLLCDACNTAIGRVDDRIDLLEKAIEYLKNN